MINNLSIFIIAKNEADRIANTINAIKDLSDDIIVIDSGSIDDTVTIAESLGAKVIFNEWPGYGKQKQFGEDNCKNDWLLNLDADEVVTPDLKQEIIDLFKSEPEPAAYSFPIAEVFPFEDTPHKWAYALKPVRLYHKSIGRYNPSIVHDRVDLERGTKITALKGFVAHYSVRSIGDQIIKLNNYADAQAIDMHNRGKNYSVLRLVFEFPVNFLKAYIGRRHFLRGVYGFMSAMNYAFYRYLRMAKHWESKLNKN